jgi:hypothetical protein
VCRYTHSVVLLLVLCLSLCVYIAVRVALCLPLGAQPSACLLGKPLTPCSATCLTMQDRTEVSLPPTHSPCSTHTTVYTSLLRSSSLPLFLCCTYSIAHYRMFVNRQICTIVAAFICAGCIPCQLGPRPPCTAQRMSLCIHACVYYYCLFFYCLLYIVMSMSMCLIMCCSCSWSLCVLS